MSASHGTKPGTNFASVDTPESASDRRRAKRIRQSKQTRAMLRDARQQLRDARALLGVKRPAAV